MVELTEASVGMRLMETELMSSPFQDSREIVSEINAFVTDNVFLVCLILVSRPSQFKTLSQVKDENLGHGEKVLYSVYTFAIIIDFAYALIV